MTKSFFFGEIPRNLYQIDIFSAIFFQVYFLPPGTKNFFVLLFHSRMFMVFVKVFFNFVRGGKKAEQARKE